MAVQQDQEEYQDVLGGWPQIQELLRKNVRRFADHYMGYDAHPDLDDYYRRLAILHARRAMGHDAFAPHALFGRLPFGAYVAAAIRLVGFAYQHMHFATEAALLFPDSDPRNLVTTWISLDRHAEFLGGALECDHRDAVDLLRLFAADTRVIRELAKVADAPAPFFIPVGQGYYASSIAATILAPYDLLLRRLRAEFPDDWFRHVDTREATFRQNLKWLFPIKHVHYADKPVFLRRGSHVATDVDAVVLVKATGTLGLFQLKWQDTFGLDLRERRSRMTNLVPSANRWVDTVLRWIESNGTDALLVAAGFPKETLGSVKQVLLFVLSRYHVGFSGSDPPDTRAAWSTWPELLRLIDERGSAADPVLTLFQDMKSAYETGMRATRTRVGRIPLRGFEIEVREQVSAAEEWGLVSERLIP